MNALAYQADPSCVDPAKLSPTPQRGGRRRSQARSMSVQSSLDPYGSSTTLNSESASSEIESSPRLSSDGSRGSPLGRLSNWNHTKYSLNVIWSHCPKLKATFTSVLNRKCQHHLHNLIFFKSNNIYSHSMRLKKYISKCNSRCYWPLWNCVEC